MIVSTQLRTGFRRCRPAAFALAILGLGATAAIAAPSTSPSAAPCTFKAAFVADVTVPDGSIVAPGKSFTKVWRIRNTGTCPWGPGTVVDSLTFVGGTRMGAPVVVDIDEAIGPGQTGEVSVTFKAPALAGLYRSEWKLRQTDGTVFGVGPDGHAPLFVLFRVGTGSGGPSSGAAQRIRFTAGSTVGSVSGTITFPSRPEYLIGARAGQEMTVAIVSAGEAANFSIEGVSDGVAYKRLVNEDRYITFDLPTTQDYKLRVAVPGGSASYIVSVAITP